MLHWPQHCMGDDDDPYFEECELYFYEDELFEIDSPAFFSDEEEIIQMEQSPAPTPPGANMYQGNTSNINVDQRNGPNKTPLRNYDDSYRDTGQTKSSSGINQNYTLPGNNRDEWNEKRKLKIVFQNYLKHFL